MPEQVLRDAENPAGQPRGNSSDGAVNEARSAETFLSTVSGRGVSKVAKGSVKGSLKKKGPLIAIAAILAIFVGLIFAAQSLMPFAIVNRLIEEFNTAGITSVLRSDNVLDIQLSSREELFGLTNYQKESLAENGILYFDVDNSTMLAFSNNQDEWGIVASTDQVQYNPNAAASLLRSKYPDKTFSKFIDPMILSVEDGMKNQYFKKSYTTASKTWRGGNAGWYDTLASLNESIHGYTRSRYWFTSSHELSSNLARSTKYLGYRNSLSTTLWNIGTGRRTPKQFLQDHIAGTKVGKLLGIKTSDNAFNRSFTEENLKLNAAAIASGAATLANLTCTGLQMVNKAQNLIASIQNMQFVNLASGFMESAQMVQAGDGDGNVMNSYADNLVTTNNGKNAMQSDAMSALMTGSPIDENSDSMQRVNPESAMANISSSSSGNMLSRLLYTGATSITNIMSALNTCNTIASGLSALSTVITVAVGVATAGMGAIVKLAVMEVVGIFAKAAIGSELENISQAISQWIWDNFAASIAKNVATEWFGEDLGNALFSGADYILGTGHQIGSGTPASKTKVMLYRREQDRIIAEEAEYQRSIRSPFDVNSQYTFLGSIVYSLVPLATTSGVGSALKNVSTIMTSSVTNILPTASAIAETNLVSGFGNCPMLEEIGAACDKAGRPYIISDVNTLNSVTPQRAADKVVSLKGATRNPDGTYTIVENSNADRFLRYCGERASNFGAADAGIIEDITNAEHESQWWRKIPLIGSVIGDIVDFAKGIFGNETQTGWATGAYCVNSEENSCFWESEGKYYQAFFQDQRFLENAGAVEKGAGALALEAYHDKNPIDQSFEGTLARYSGMTKDDVIATLDFIEVMNYLANYHPEEREMAVEMAVVNGPVECGIMNLCFTTTAPSKTPSSTNAVTPILALAPKRLNVVVSNLATTSSA